MEAAIALGLSQPWIFYSQLFKIQGIIVSESVLSVCLSVYLCVWLAAVFPSSLTMAWIFIGFTWHFGPSKYHNKLVFCSIQSIRHQSKGLEYFVLFPHFSHQIGHKLFDILYLVDGLGTMVSHMRGTQQMLHQLSVVVCLNFLPFPNVILYMECVNFLYYNLHITVFVHLDACALIPAHPSLYVTVMLPRSSATFFGGFLLVKSHTCIVKIQSIFSL